MPSHRDPAGAGPTLEPGVMFCMDQLSKAWKSNSVIDSYSKYTCNDKCNIVPHFQGVLHIIQAVI
jgi:hypothetical protein